MRALDALSVDLDVRAVRRCWDCCVGGPLYLTEQNGRSTLLAIQCLQSVRNSNSPDIYWEHIRSWKSRKMGTMWNHLEMLKDPGWVYLASGAGVLAVGL